MKKKTVTRQDILFFFISTFVLTAAWIGFNLYHTWVTSTITPELQMQIIPIDPTFDTATLNQLKQRNAVVPRYEIQSKTASPTAAATEIPTDEPEGTAEADIVIQGQ